MAKYRTALRNWIYALLIPIPLLGLVGLPRYVMQWISYRMKFGTRLNLSDSHPCLTDWVRATPFDAHYFYQAAWLARRVAAGKPIRHVDIGSDIRMINVLSAFVPTEFLDYRPLNVSLEGLICNAGNLTSLDKDNDSISSLSCLHVVEHVGLGRYGDPIDPDGSRKALSELQRVLSPGGRLYLSLPVGRERVCFNAHRVFDPQTIINAMSSLRLLEFSLVDDVGAFHESVSPDMAASLEYGCGLFIFEKP
jgi:SAM-dependent methyltransferase